MASPAAINQSAQILKLLIDAINKFREQPLENLRLSNACSDFKNLLEQNQSRLASLDLARPVVPEWKWKLIVDLRNKVQEAKEELTNEEDGLLNFIDLATASEQSQSSLSHEGENITTKLKASRQTYSENLMDVDRHAFCRTKITCTYQKN